MATWSPSQYAVFSSERLRPAIDLLARIDHEDPRLIHDVGCGRGEAARLMAKRWPEAVVVGSDLSDEMLAEARGEPSGVEWRRLDLATWQPDPEHDILFANAVLHWLPDHDELLGRLVSGLAPGGVLAIQMPVTWDEPIVAVARALVGDAAFAGRRGLPSIGWYYDRLAPSVSELELWETTYVHALEGADPVVEWAKGAALRPVLESLGEQADDFLTDYAAAMRQAYPTRSDGATLLPYPRRFIVARAA